MRRSLAALALAAAALGLAAPLAHADDRISITNDGGCYTLWVEAKHWLLFCYNPPPI
jgi:hypothetical protein